MSTRIAVSFMLVSADCGGFVVTEGGRYNVNTDRYDGQAIAYAGPLGDCLNFMRSRLAGELERQAVAFLGEAR
jgi:hypothetical protein